MYFIPKDLILEFRVLSLKKKVRASLFVIFIVLSFLNSNTFAQEEKETLSQRLDRLEKQNEELSKALKERLSSTPSASSKEDIDNLLLKNPAEIPVKNVLALPAMGVDAVPGTSKNPAPMKISFKNGFWAESEDKNFSFNFGPMMQFDNGWYSTPSNINSTLDNPLTDGSALRRFRLNAIGTVLKQFEYRMEVDFSGATDFRTTTADPQAPLFLTDAWVAMNEIPFIGTVRIGHQKEFLTFANGTSDRYYPFMERPLVFDAFEDGNQFNNGVTLSNSYFDKKLHIWTGLFRTGTRTGAFGVGGGRTAFDQRISYFPILNLEEQHWWVLQAHGTERSLPLVSTSDGETQFFKAPQVQFFNRPLVRAGSGFQVPRIISSPTLFSQDGETSFGLGTQTAYGRWTFGAEYVATQIYNAYLNTVPGYVSSNGRDAQSIGNQYYDGFYVQGLCFLTPGDHRSVNPENPGFIRISPVRPFQWRRTDDGSVTRGPGAWEVKFRYDYSNIQNPFFTQAFIPTKTSGGNYQAYTFGINWYTNTNMSVMADYNYNYRDAGKSAGSGSFSSFGMRTQFEF